MSRSRARTRGATLCAVALSGAVVAGCSSGGSTGVTATASTTTSTTTAVTTTSTTAAPLVGGATTPVSTPIQGHAKLTGIKAGDQGGFDRITFTFTGGLPGYAVRYIARPVQADASGQTIEVAGDSILQIHMAGASGVDLSGGKVTKTYTGPNRFSPTTPTVAELVDAGDFEDVLTWVAGVRGKDLPFKVTTDTAAGQLIIDIAHP